MVKNQSKSDSLDQEFRGSDRTRKKWAENLTQI